MEVQNNESRLIYYLAGVIFRDSRAGCSPRGGRRERMEREVQVQRTHSRLNCIPPIHTAFLLNESYAPAELLTQKPTCRNFCIFIAGLFIKRMCNNVPAETQPASRRKLEVREVFLRDRGGFLLPTYARILQIFTSGRYCDKTLRIRIFVDGDSS
ncbi:hypothetical protein Zmor_001098 [Zophobas morio]|uniref:Uncharacterized protein n=1 Tax=Zophobas morio TaxID=2755281 RepID=A0AA38IYM3_9CUCU|nr:hypothetical protein Zmor_001098 [Zophobas morio]